MPANAAIGTISAHEPRALDNALWTAQTLLAVAFGFFGLTKLTLPASAVPFPAGLLHFIAMSEVLGAIGLILPMATGIKPRLTALAAAGLFVIMVLAALFHVSRGELAAVPTTVVLGALAAFVVWGRRRIS